MKGLPAPSPEIAAVAMEFQDTGGITRFPKVKGLKNAFWTKGWLVLVQVNPRKFPDLYTKFERDLIYKEAMRDGCGVGLLVAWVKSVPPSPPVLVKIKNLPL